MKFNEEKLVGIAKKAKELGIELFVLDEGGFSHRDDDATWIYQGDYQSRRLSLKLFTDPKLRCQKKPEKR